MVNYKKLDQVFDLVSKTNDKVIVVSENHDPYVLMGLKEYEALLKGFAPINDLTEEQLLEKINRDIAIWKSSQNDLEGYDLEDFKVESLKKKEKVEVKDKAPENNLGADKKADVNTATVDEDDKYYIEPLD
ncbi:MAG: hypothetical protein COV55_01260 [Candidatus Komeilibacteria bacterium CG11_big_fil_rev_8_21_14_0_20_36_20]|uniref:Antitoxin n=1 Tax=Candidatus Komeilibacteria bacterium CG11_big_fil_rev_8_21_14_0_20_36_20 TaxID=1974477 RepID=A0A2H0NDS1_9BACT|nr:MAG: hypothetical protein COV55_01260 [Candidatus Komeilibacteria bacterium CG11_big_fil_rev_8_21_14_0_20_36_20]PIR81409.1 MAG: hypothetical protein COU21_04230 [Candidatus Komeilibacteria bacterium CG10_big_fil_rev_8_21_14_0_10_36_65]PJC55134.1 MAG: hypothetical protein CO027_03185 [Candidatus Komeilibacteria bacterium CG_4_9_14_0_2_um_filter_36_13]